MFVKSRLQIRRPILFLSGLRDELVPPSHMEMLYAKAAAHNKQCLFVDFPTGAHMDTWEAGGDRYWRTIKEFVDKVVLDEKEESNSARGGVSFCMPSILFARPILIDLSTRRI